MGWDEVETLEMENNMSKGNEELSKSKKKRNKKKSIRGDATSAPVSRAEDAESKGAGSSSGWEGTNNSNSQRRISPGQGTSQSDFGFCVPQGQKAWADPAHQGEQNTNLDGGWEVVSSRRSTSQSGSSNSNSAAHWKGGTCGLSSAGFKEDAARRSEPDFNGSVQNPPRWPDRSRSNRGWDKSYKSGGFNEGSNPESKGPKNPRVQSWAARNRTWQVESKREKNQTRGMFQSQRTGANLETVYMETVHLPPPLTHGWQWGSKVHGSAIYSTGTNESPQASHDRNDLWSSLLPSEKLEGEHESMQKDGGAYQSRDSSEIDRTEEGSDDDWLGSGDDDESDASQESHEAQKKNKWFRKFFQSLDALTIEQVNDSSRQWHCPACQGGVGAIDWYKGMQPLLAHAKTVRSKRVKIHRKLAEVLDEELERRGAAGLAAKEMLGKWKGLQEVTNDHEIVWPPMVVVQNTLLDQDEKDMWLGMGNKELLEYFKGYKAMKARHAYGPHGHRGMSVLIFEDSAMGYLEAEHLHKHFLGEDRGKDGWEKRRVLFQPGGKRVLYGYLPTTEDIQLFNKHSKGKARLKYDIRSYQMMVVEPMKKMNEDNQKLIWFKSKVTKEQEHNKILEQTVSIVGRKLQMKESEIKIIRQRATEQHEESTREMNYLEQSYRQQIQQLYEDIMRKENTLEKMQEDFKKEHIDLCHQLEVDCVKLSKDMNVSKDEQEEQAKMHEEITKQKSIVEMSIKNSEEYEKERQELVRDHDKKRREFRTKQLLEEVKYEKEFEQERLQILETYFKRTQEAVAQSII